MNNIYTCMAISKILLELDDFFSYVDLINIKSMKILRLIKIIIHTLLRCMLTVT